MDQIPYAHFKWAKQITAVPRSHLLVVMSSQFKPDCVPIKMLKCRICPNDSLIRTTPITALSQQDICLYDGLWLILQSSPCVGIGTTFCKFKQRKVLLGNFSVKLSSPSAVERTQWKIILRSCLCSPPRPRSVVSAVYPTLVKCQTCFWIHKLLCFLCTLTISGGPGSISALQANKLFYEALLT